MDLIFSSLTIPARVLIKANGERTNIERGTVDDHAKLIDAGNALEVVRLRHLSARVPYVMLIDDNGHGKRLPVNEAATQLYHANCRPGTTHTIRGDVVIVPDTDFQNF